METNEVTFKQGVIRLGEKSRVNMYEPTDYVAFEVPASAGTIGSRFEVFVKVFMNGFYGVLGGQFVPDATGVFQARVGVFEEPESELVSHTGLTSEYARVVAERLREITVQHEYFVSGVLTIDRAWHHEVYSSAFMFRLVTSAIASMLRNGGEIPSQETVNAWFQELLNDLRHHH